ncbi:MAG: SufD family Fe-S cluster assembly protein [Thiotrichales bacterium]|jgi:Fe-S cluster assembly protein SufD|nr:SufD family Fe-S cluster assembly protein [Thiotrichales bacterium]
MTLSQPLLNAADDARSRWHALIANWLSTQSSQAPVEAKRLEALAAFTQMPLPTPRHEDWKYTRLANLWKQNYQWEKAPVTSEIIPVSGLPENAIRLIFVNGLFAPELSTALNALPAGLTINTQLSALMPIDWQTDDALSALAVASVSAGAMINIAANAQISQPIAVCVIGERVSQVQSIQLQVTVGKNASATFIEVVTGAEKGLMLSQLALSIAENAHCCHLFWQDVADTTYYFGWRNATLARDARLLQRTLSVGGILSRQQYTVTIQGENAEADTATGVVALGKQTHDIRTHTRHACLNARSRQLHRFAIGGQANGVFHGDIYVERGADKTDANMATNNLLLSPQAQANSKPQLEIYADDVRCTHGVTSGNLDEAQIFYLRARGIPESQARLLVSAAFAQAALADVPVAELADVWHEVIAQKLQQAVVV